VGLNDLVQKNDMIKDFITKFRNKDKTKEQIQAEAEQKAKTK
jgi:hypothetical protein